MVAMKLKTNKAVMTKKIVVALPTKTVLKNDIFNNDLLLISNPTFCKTTYCEQG